MDYVIFSDPVVRLAFWIGVLVILLTSALALLLVWMRRMLIKRLAWQKHFLSVWRNILIESLENTPTSLPSIHKQDWLLLFNLWNLMHDFLRGEASEKLNQFARLTDMDQVARRWLKKPRVRDRLIAVITLGRLRDQQAWPSLCEIMRGKHSTLSLAAARALIQIDPNAALPIILPAILDRQDWPPSRIASFLGQASSRMTHQLADATLQTVSKRAPGVLRHLLESGYNKLFNIADALHHSQNDEIISACLQSVSNPADLPSVRHYARHANWRLRVQAANALGRIGTRLDIPLLTGLLSDPQWWVRYRAAQAITRLPSVDDASLQKMQTQLEDPYARDILRQAIAESQLPCLSPNS